MEANERKEMTDGVGSGGRGGETKSLKTLARPRAVRLLTKHACMRRRLRNKTLIWSGLFVVLAELLWAHSIGGKLCCPSSRESCVVPSAFVVSSCVCCVFVCLSVCLSVCMPVRQSVSSRPERRANVCCEIEKSTLMRGTRTSNKRFPRINKHKQCPSGTGDFGSLQCSAPLRAPLPA
jgi:hypothetical protein